MQAKVLRCELKVEGMFCSSCELRIEQALYKLDGIINVEASYSGSVVRIAYDQDVIQLPEIVAAIEAEDYRVKPIPGHTGIKIDMERRIGEEPTSVNQVLGIIIILFALYLIVRNTIGFNFIPQVDQSMGYGILFLVGVLTSLHCISMCGGINLSQCVGHDFSGDEDNKLARLKPSFMYNLGRVISYTIIGGIVGALGSAVSFSGTAKGVVALVAGAFMIIMGINMLNLFPGLRIRDYPGSLETRQTVTTGEGNHYTWACSTGSCLVGHYRRCRSMHWLPVVLWLVLCPCWRLVWEPSPSCLVLVRSAPCSVPGLRSK